MQHSSPDSSNFQFAPSSSFSGAMQSKRPQRPVPSSAFQPQVGNNSQQPQFQTPSRPSAMSSSHSHSLSSPAAGPKQDYVAFSSNTPDSNKYSSTPAGRHFIPQSPTGAPSHSPLGLADIRPQADLHFNEEISSPNSSSSDGLGITQTNCNYIAPWAVHAFDWCDWVVHGGGAGKMAICSHLEDPHNFIQVLDTQIRSNDTSSPRGPAYGLDFVKIAEATCSYPITRILWEPSSSQKQTTDLLATSGDHLRLWSLPTASPNPSNYVTRPSNPGSAPPEAQKLVPLALLSNSKTQEHTAPLTSLDWNKLSPKLIITSSIDTTCTIWDIPTLTAKTQLIAHDKEVFDVRFCAGSVDTFVSCGADGSVRMFDLRCLEHSTIIYEPSEKAEQNQESSPMSPGGNQPLNNSPPPPLLRVATSPHDSHLLATFASDSRIIRILDHRQPGQALLELHGHSAPINCIEWSPSRRGVLSSGADDSLVLSWDLINPQNSAAMGTVNGTPIGQPDVSGANVKGPASSWRCDFEVDNLSWSPPSPLTNHGGDWLGITGGRGVWGVKFQ